MIHSFLRRLAVLAMLTTACMAQAQSQPPLKLIVPFPAGTPVDVMARTLAQTLATELARPVIVDNRPGAAGNIGTEAVINAPADGATLLFTVGNPITINPLLYTKLKANPMKELKPIAKLATGGVTLVSRRDLGLHTAKDLELKAKAEPGKLTYTSLGLGSLSHMCAEIFQAMTQAKLLHVPYKAGGLVDMIGGQVDIGFEPTAPALPHIQNGTIVALAVTTRGRIDILKDVPPMADTYAGYECTSWGGVLAPGNLPDAQQAALSAAVIKAAKTPAYSRLLLSMGFELDVQDWKGLGQTIREDHAKWERVLKPLNIRLD